MRLRQSWTCWITCSERHSFLFVYPSGEQYNSLFWIYFCRPFVLFIGAVGGSSSRMDGDDSVSKEKNPFAVVVVLLSDAFFEEPSAPLDSQNLPVHNIPIPRASTSPKVAPAIHSGVISACSALGHLAVFCCVNIIFRTGLFINDTNLPPPRRSSCFTRLCSSCSICSNLHARSQTML